MEQAIYYYNISVGLEATWDKNVYTYHSASKLEAGNIVSVPFGKNTKLGYVVSQTDKPKVNTKEATLLIEGNSLPDSSLRLIDWLNKSYPSMPGLHTQLLVPSLVKSLKPEDFSLINSPKIGKLPELTSKQLDVVNQLMTSEKPQILHGITGSGKTRVYQELTAKFLDEGKNVLILYPEISLTTHIQSAFEKLVPTDNLHIFHSKNKPKSQRKTWANALANKTGQVFIGPRSALFLPICNLGLIILDEAHDNSYKQDNGSRYSGLMTAGALAKIHKAKLIFGSATPPLQETTHIQSRGGSIVCLHELAISETKSGREFEIIDMTNKSNLSSTSHLLSKSLLESIKQSLGGGKQSLLFLNRRGTARSLVCASCGWHASCSRCDSPMTYHHDTHSLICHICGQTNKTPTSCPDCSKELSQKSPGTKAIESELTRLFPNSKIMRFDSDNKKSESMSENYQQIRDGKADIIIGTQIITKGLDLPSLETVGILQADSSLYLPDFSSREHSFQQLLQVSGRTGRGHISGRVILQTYSPENELFKYIINQDWHNFYNSELESRQKANFPPYSFLCRIWVSKPSEKSAQSAITKLSQQLSNNNKIRILGPAPSFYAKNAGKYSWQIIIMSKSRIELATIAQKLPKDTYYDLDPVSLL